MQEEAAAEMFVHDAIVALAADPKSCESFYPIKITEDEKRRRKMWKIVSVTLSREG